MMMIVPAVILVLCASSTIAGEILLTNEEAVSLFTEALKEYKKFSENGNKFATDAPHSTTHEIQGKKITVTYKKLGSGVFVAHVPEGVDVTFAQFSNLEELFKMKAKEMFREISTFKIERLGHKNRYGVSVEPDTKHYSFLYNFPTQHIHDDDTEHIYHILRAPPSQSVVPTPPKIILTPSEITQCIQKALNNYEMFVSLGNKLGSPFDYSIIKVRGTDLKIGYEIDHKKKFFTARLYHSFVREKDVSVVKNVLRAMTRKVPDVHLTSGVLPETQPDQGLGFIVWPEQYWFLFSFPVIKNDGNMLFELINHLIE